MSFHFVIKGDNKPMGAAFSHARKVAAKTGGGKEKEREVANRYLRGKGEKAIGKSEAEAFDVLGDYLSKADGHTPPQGVRSACKRGLKLAPEHGGDGLTDGAKARARSMASGGSVSMANIKRMKAFFARHTEAKTANPPSPGYVAWLLWGGDAGKAWANKMADSDDTAKSLTTQDSDMEACDVLHDYLSKSASKGEGSRGGHIIGHTKSSGHPIYAGHNATHKAYKDMGGEAHMEASRMHQAEAAKYKAKAADTSTPKEDKAKLRGAAKRHENKAYTHSRANASLWGAMRSGYDNASYLAGQSHKDPDNKAKDSAFNTASRKASDARDAFDGKPYQKPETVGGQTESGQDIHDSDSKKHYGKLKFADPNDSTPEQRKQAALSNAKHVKAAYPNFTANDHIDAAKYHEDVNAHGVAGAHFAAAGWHGPDGAAKDAIHAQYRKSEVEDMDLVKGDATASDVIASYLSKGGEGSRGGHVIGHSNGHPIYAAGHASYKGVKAIGDAITGPNGTKKVKANVKAVIAAHPHFSPEDHYNAFLAHHNDTSHDKNVDAGVAHFHASKGTFAKNAKKSMHSADWTACDVLGAYTAGNELSKAGGAGSRGGKVIGHTRSGKPIYASGESTHFGSKADFGDAAAKHSDRAQIHQVKAQQYRSEGNRPKFVEHSDLHDHHRQQSVAHLKSSMKGEFTNKSMDAGFGDNAQQFADENNMDPNMIQVRAVDDLNNSALNDAIAAAWPGRPYMGNSAQSFCDMANNMNYRTGV